MTHDDITPGRSRRGLAPDSGLEMHKDRVYIFMMFDSLISMAHDDIAPGRSRGGSARPKRDIVHDLMSRTVHGYYAYDYIHDDINYAGTVSYRKR